MLKKAKLQISENRSQSLIVSAVLIFLMACDLFALNNLLVEANTDSTTALVLSSVMAVVLEGAPVIIGLALGILLDESELRRNKKETKIGLLLALVVMGMVFFVVVQSRHQVILNHSTFGHRLEEGESREVLDTEPKWVSGYDPAFRQSQNDFSADWVYGQYSDFPKDYFLLWSPVLTSLVAFLLSWFYFRTSYADLLEQRMYRTRNDYYASNAQRRSTLLHVTDLKVKIWSSLGLTTVIPDEDEELFRQCNAATRHTLQQAAPLVSSSLSSIYESSIELELLHIMQRLADLSSIPHEILKLDVHRLIEEVNQSWNTNESWRSEDFQALLIEQLVSVVQDNDPLS